MKVLPFTYDDYDKLTHRVFMTLRRRDKYGDPGDTLEVMIGKPGNRGLRGHAQIVAKERVTLGSLNRNLFHYDTQSVDFDEALESINEFYRDPIDLEEKIMLYWFVWVWRREETEESV